MTKQTRTVTFTITEEADTEYQGPPPMSRIIATGEVVEQKVYLQVVVPDLIPFPQDSQAQWEIVEGLRALLYDILERLFPVGRAMTERADVMRELMSRVLPEDAVEEAVQGVMKRIRTLDDLIREVVDGPQEEGEGEGEGQGSDEPKAGEAEGSFPFTLLSPEEVAAQGRTSQEGEGSGQAKPQGEASQEGETR